MSRRPGRYTRQVLRPGEEVIAVGRFHWLYTVTAVLCLLLLGRFLIGILIFVRMMIEKWTTEIVIGRIDIFFSVVKSAVADLLSSNRNRSLTVITHDRSSEQRERQMIDLFISHSSKDTKLVSLLVDLIRSALRLPSESIRCTSVDGYRLPGGANTLEHLRIEVQEAVAFLGIISHSSLDSMYVAFELGARWGAGKHLLPLLAPGVDAGMLRGPLTALNALRCDSAGQLHQLIGEVADLLGRKTERPEAIQDKIEAVTTWRALS